VQRPRLPIKGIEFWRIGDVLDDYWPYVHCACAGKGYFGASSKKNYFAIRFSDLDFLYDRCIFIIGWCICDILDVFVQPRRVTFTLFHILRLTFPTHTETLIILGLSVTESWSMLNLITFPLTWSMFLKSLTPIYLFTLSLSEHYVEDSAMWSPKIAFLPFCEGYKVHCECTVSCDLCIRGHQNQT